MRMNNYTDIDDKIIRTMIGSTRPNGISNFDVMIKNCKYHGGRGAAYYNGSSLHKTKDPFIVVSVQRKELTKRYTTHNKHGYLGCTVYSRQELLLFLIAHELRHLWQKKIRKGYRVWGSRGQYSERDADAYGIRMLRAWRKQEQQKA